MHKACRFTNAFYFIDDLYAIGGNSLFEENFIEIYPGKLELKRENVSTSFPYNGIEIQDKILTKLYDKLACVPFEMVHVSFLNNQILQLVLRYSV